MDPRNSLVDQYVWDVQPMVAEVLDLVQACGGAVAENLVISACERRRVQCGPTP